METSTIRILVVDDYEPFRRFVRSKLEQSANLRVIGEASDGLEAVRKAEELQPDLIVLDIALPTLNGIAAARKMRAPGVRSRILFLSQDCSKDIADEALGSGAQGYVVKSCAAGELIIAVEAVVQGRQFLSSGLVTLLPRITYTFNANKTLIHTRCAGSITFDDVIGHFRELKQDPTCPHRLDLFLDLSEMTSLPESSQLRAISNEIGKIRERVRFGLCAIVAGRDALFGMMRVFERDVEQHFSEIRIFRGAAEAETWLTLKRSEAQPGT